MKYIISAFILVFCSISHAAFQLDKPLSPGGMTFPMNGHLTATSGLVDVSFTLPADWPAKGDQALFHAGVKSHTHVTLFFRAGTLIAVYKADKDHYCSINYSASRKWNSGSSHCVQLQWCAEGNDVPFYLRVDGKLFGNAHGQLITRWPDQFSLGVRGKTSVWEGAINKVSISPDPPVMAEFVPGSRTISVDTSKVEGKIYNFWSIANFTREDPFTNKLFHVHQKSLNPFMQYVNCVRLLGGRPDGRNKWFKGLDDKGDPVFDFAGLVDILQGIMDAGYTPRIVLDNVPLEMSGDVKMEEYGNTHPPRDYALWEKYIEAAVRAMVDAFGLEKVSSWRFRVGTEPDLYPGHWIGTPEQYKHHYVRTVAAVRKVIPQPDIGPGNILNTEHGKWGIDLVDYIATNNLPMTFFSCSWYGRVGEDQQGFEQNIETMRVRLDQYERFKNIPIEIAEFAILNDEYNRRLWCGDATEWGASWYAGIAEKVYRLDVAQVHQWATTTSGLLHPRSHVHTMLGFMDGGQRIAVSVSGAVSTALAGALAARQGESIYVMLYNHRPLRHPQVPETIRLNIKDDRMKAGEKWKMSKWQVDRDHGVFMHAFVEDCGKAGLKPLPDSAVLGGDIRRRWGTEGVNVLKKNFNKYRELSKLPQVVKNQPLEVQECKVEITVEMPGHSVQLLRFFQ